MGLPHVRGDSWMEGVKVVNIDEGEEWLRHNEGLTAIVVTVL